MSLSVCRIVSTNLKQFLTGLKHKSRPATPKKTSCLKMKTQKLKFSLCILDWESIVELKCIVKCFVLLGSTNLCVRAKARSRSPTPHIISKRLQNDPVQSFDQRSEAKQSPGLRVGLTYPPGLRVQSAIYDVASNWQCRPARDISPLIKAFAFCRHRPCWDSSRNELCLGFIAEALESGSLGLSPKGRDWQDNPHPFPTRHKTGRWKPSLRALSCVFIACCEIKSVWSRFFLSLWLCNIVMKNLGKVQTKFQKDNVLSTKRKLNT